MILLQNYMNDGVNHQAQAVLALMRHFQIESSWDSDRKEYAAEIKVNHWFNGRESGYLFSLLHPTTFENLNIVVYEHRNSDAICAVKWVQGLTLNPICTIELAKFPEGTFVDKWNVSKSVNYGQILEMVEWIKIEFEDWFKLKNLIK